MLNAKRCSQCGARYARHLSLCPVCGHERLDRGREVICAVCGASLTAGQRQCPYCGSVRRAPLAGVLPLVGRIGSSLAILALGAALIWWILPLGMSPTDGEQGAGEASQMVPAAGVSLAPPSTPTAGSGSAVAAGEAVTAESPQSLPASETTPVSPDAAQAASITSALTPEAAAGATAEATPTALPTMLATATQETGPVTHTVVQGDVLGRIAAQYDVTLAALLEANDLTEDSVLRIGDTLVIPVPVAVATESPAAPTLTPSAIAAPTATTQPAGAAAAPLIHVVEAGDTLGSLAVRYQVSSADIAAENSLSLSSILRIGQQLIIPAPTGVPEATGTPATLATSTATATLTQIAPTATVTSAGAGASAALPASPVITTPFSATPAALPTLPVTLTLTATPTATPTTAITPTAAPTLRVHTVQSGQHIGIIAAMYDLTMQEIADANGIAVSAILQVGQQLLIPGPASAVEPDTTPVVATPSIAATPAPVVVTPEPAGAPTPQPQIHVVQQGDTLGGIAVRYQVASASIASANGLAMNAVLSIGQELIIPGVTPVATSTAVQSTPPPMATLQANATPTPFPYRTRSTAVAYRQPRLLTPANGAVLDSAGQPVLQWSSVGILKDDEWYRVRLWTPDGGTEPLVFRTRATSVRLADDVSPASRRSDRFLWDVTVVRLTPDGSGLQELSTISQQRAFRWR